MPAAFKGSVFLLSLVLAASMMPVERLPDASWQTTLGLGFVSAVFDNIPLTALALKQGGYDWGYVAYAVGFGGSMIWFGSSAGVALTNIYPDGKNAIAWVKSGWHVALAYVIGFIVMLAVQGWVPQAEASCAALAGSRGRDTQTGAGCGGMNRVAVNAGTLAPLVVAAMCPVPAVARRARPSPA